MKNKNSKMKALIGTVLAVTTMFTGILGGAAQTVSADSSVTINASAAFAIEYETGKVLFNQNGDTKLGIASMTKMFTEYLVLEAINEGKLSWDQKVSISEYAYQISQNNELSNVALSQDKQYTVRELFDAMAIFSANGAAIALAEQVAGSEPKFVDMMRELAEKLNMENYTLVNCTGLSNEDLYGNIYPGSSEADENEMTARDVAILAQSLIKTYPEVLDTAKIPEKTFQEGTVDEILMSNWNWMLPGLLYERAGVDGLKTGSTIHAGSCFTATAVQDGMRVITVVMDAKDTSGEGGDMSYRFIETDRLLDEVFGNWETKTFLKEGQEIKDNKTVPVVDGKEDKVKIGLSNDITLVVPKDTEEDQLAIAYNPDKKLLNDDNELQAPVKKGDVVGTASVKVADDTLGYLDKSESKNIDVKTTEKVEKANFFVRLWRSIVNFFKNLFS